LLFVVAAMPPAARTVADTFSSIARPPSDDDEPSPLLL
jgi:hypothetical protein